MERIILHCDLNNFFASVALLHRPELKGKPVAVCGDSQVRHGIILAKNEVAKRFGVKTAEAIWQAQAKCPSLILLPPDYNEYMRYSRAVREIYRRYTDRIESFGIDECWLDVTGSTLLFGSGEEIAYRIKEEVKSVTGLTISVGVSFNKVFAKLGSDMKKPDAVTVIKKENFKEKIWPLSVGTLLFAGNSTCKKLNQNGIFKIGDLAMVSDATISRLLGKNGGQLKSFALGLDNSPVSLDTAKMIPKSVGRSETAATDYITDESVWQSFLNFSDEIAATLRKNNLFAAGVQITLKKPDFSVNEFSCRLFSPTNVGLMIARAGMQLYLANKQGPYRMVGIRAISLREALSAVQASIFDDSSVLTKQERLETEMDIIRARYGDGAIMRGTLIGRTPHDIPKDYRPFSLCT